MKAKICPICQNIYPSYLTECTNCKYREPMDGRNALIIAIIVLIAAFVFNYFLEHEFYNGASSINETSQKNEIIYNVENKTQTLNLIDIPIRPMSSLSGLTKKEIYEKRTKYVNKSIIFSKLNKNYSPNKEVYNIEDNLPWISAYEIAKNGVKDNPNLGYGASRHSIFVNNPELLIGFIIPDFNKGKNRKDFSEVDYLHPKKILWDEQNKTIKAYFDLNSYFEKYPYWKGASFYTDETNARDMGYNWIYCQDKRRVIFNSMDNILKSPYQMRGYYHRGYSCKLEGGCNNYSPYQQNMIFQIMTNNSYLKLKLWKKKPISKLQKADMYYEMYFE